MINLPWWGVGLAALGVALCVPVFLLALARGADPVAPVLYTHLPVSFAISGLVALTQVFFTIEILSQRLLYPVFFRESRPAGTPGTLALSLRGRGLLLAMSAGVCPVLSLLLLSLVPPGSGHDVRPFAFAVGGLGIALGLGTAWLLGRLVAEPVAELERATRAVTAGDLDVRIATLRADEFGLLIDRFNTMVAEMREKRRVEESFGRHVGTRVARQILARDGGPGGAEQELTVMFVDIRDFTTRAEASTPSQLVALLNVFLTEMVEVIEQGHGEIVNKFLGDGLMALFGEWTGRPDHADAALAAGGRCSPAWSGSTGRPRRRERGAPCHRDRHPHRAGGGRQHRLAPAPRVHGHRRYRERRVAGGVAHEANGRVAPHHRLPRAGRSTPLHPSSPCRPAVPGPRARSRCSARPLRRAGPGHARGAPGPRAPEERPEPPEARGPVRLFRGPDILAVAAGGVSAVIPYHDENKTQRPAYVTLALIGLNVATWLFVQGAGSGLALARSVCELGLIPGELAGLVPPGTEIPHGRGHRVPHRPGATALEPGHLDVPPRLLDAPDRQHVVPLAVREQRGRLHEPAPVHRVLPHLRPHGRPRCRW